MNVTELMVGDYVRISGMYRGDKIIRLTAKDLLDIENGGALSLYIKPIELTREFFECNGFTYKPNGGIMQLGNFGKDVLIVWHINQGCVGRTPLRLECHNWRRKDMPSMYRSEIKYVHEFQHILNVCDLYDINNNIKINTL